MTTDRETDRHTQTGRLKDMQTDRHTERHYVDVKIAATLLDDLNVLVCRNGKFGHSPADVACDIAGHLGHSRPCGRSRYVATTSPDDATSPAVTMHLAGITAVLVDNLNNLG